MNKQQIKQILEEEADLDKAIEQILALGDNSPNIQHLQPVNKLDYQILSFKQNSGITELWKVDTIRGSGYWSREGYMTTIPYTTAEILSNKLYAIHSVKRLSDGEVFTIGDCVVGISKIARIISFETNEELVKRAGRHKWQGGLGMLLDDSTDHKVAITQVKKVTKTPIFKTEDGIDVFEGDTYYYLHIAANRGLIHINPWDIDSQILGGLGCNLKLNNSYVKRFSTKQAAEDYIILNKPCLSLMDLKKAGYISASQTLKQLVKSKL